eukprot:g11431.t1
MCNKQDLVTNVMDLSEAEARKDNPNIPKSSKVDFLAIAEEAVVMSRMAVDKANKPLIQKGVELKNRIAEIGKVPIVTFGTRLVVWSLELSYDSTHMLHVLGKGWGIITNVPS